MKLYDQMNPYKLVKLKVKSAELPSPLGRTALIHNNVPTYNFLWDMSQKCNKIKTQ